ncbi:uncharacterized protein LOC129592446 [Paramacrobiotus metropolitanus]|uniref:uncharacterized protein LOC129592446 n=1 Tax=Paramacrobiotus metropolitanus TaxID=2943436 RepID=UPI0024459F27|nr:uncharacterized protein LOC129592446 [Paramacrobiotus metropolitanus]
MEYCRKTGKAFQQLCRGYCTRVLLVLFDLKKMITVRPRFSVINIGYYGGFDKYHWDCLRRSSFMEKEGYVIAISEIKMTKDLIAIARKDIEGQCQMFYEPSYKSNYGLLLLVDKAFEVKMCDKKFDPTLGKEESEEDMSDEDPVEKEESKASSGRTRFGKKKKRVKKSDEKVSSAEEDTGSKKDAKIEKKAEEEDKPEASAEEEGRTTELLFQYIAFTLSDRKNKKDKKDKEKDKRDKEKDKKDKEKDKKWACFFGYRASSGYSNGKARQFCDLLKSFCNYYSSDHHMAIFGDFNILRKVSADVRRRGCFEYDNKTFGSDIAKMVYDAVKDAGVQDTVFTPTKVLGRDAPDYFGMSDHEHYFDAKTPELKFHAFEDEISDHRVVCQFPVEDPKKLTCCADKLCDKLLTGFVFENDDLVKHINGHRDTGGYITICSECLHYYDASAAQRHYGDPKRIPANGQDSGHPISWRIKPSERNVWRFGQNPFQIRCGFRSEDKKAYCNEWLNNAAERETHQRLHHGKGSWMFTCRATRVDHLQSTNVGSTQDLCLVKDDNRREFSHKKHLEMHNQRHNPDEHQEATPKHQCEICLLFFKRFTSHKGSTACRFKHLGNAALESRATQEDITKYWHWKNPELKQRVDKPKAIPAVNEGASTSKSK